MIPYIDIHTHSRNADRQEDIIRVYSIRLGIENEMPTPPFSAGIHPWDAANNAADDMLIDKLFTTNIAAVGEIGLDFMYNKDNHHQQTYIFERQLGIAQERGLPVIIHCVKAFEYIMTALNQYDLPAVIFHSYIGSKEQTHRIIDAGYYISVGIVSLGSNKTVESLRQFPIDRLFLESDNSGEDIAGIYSAASATLQIPLETLKLRIYENFKSLFPRYGLA